MYTKHSASLTDNTCQGRVGRSNWDRTDVTGSPTPHLPTLTGMAIHPGLPPNPQPKTSGLITVLPLYLREVSVTRPSPPLATVRSVMYCTITPRSLSRSQSQSQSQAQAQSPSAPVPTSPDTVPSERVYLSACRWVCVLSRPAGVTAGQRDGDRDTVTRHSRWRPWRDP